MARFLSREEFKAFKAQRRAAKEAAIDASDREEAERLAKVSLESKEYPRFTDTGIDGKCAQCHGVQFRPSTRGADPSAAAVFGLRAAAMTALDAMYSSELVTCITCGATYEVG